MTMVRYIVVIDRPDTKDNVEVHGGHGEIAAEILEEEILHGLEGLNVPGYVRVTRRFLHTPGDLPAADLPTYFQDNRLTGSVESGTLKA